MKRILLALAVLLGLSGAASAFPPSKLRVQNDGVSVPFRLKLNFVGGGCVDNAATGATDCTLGGGGGSTGNFSFSSNTADLTGAAVMQLGSANMTTLKALSAMADGASARALSVDTTTAWSNAGAYLLSLANHGTTEFFVRYDGNAAAKGYYNQTLVTGIDFPDVSHFDLYFNGFRKYRIVDQEIQPENDNSVQLGDSTHRFSEIRVESVKSAASTWVNISGGVGFTNSWVNFGAPYSDAGYFRDANGFVHLRGIIKDGTLSSSAFTLPAGFRPGAKSLYPQDNGGQFGLLAVDTDGTVTPQAGSNAFSTLDGITFFAEN